MLESYIIVGLTMIIVGIIKTFKPFTTARGKLCVPLLVFVVSGLLNVLNAGVFGGVLLKALNDGLVLGAISGGLYSMGKAAIEKYKA